MVSLQISLAGKQRSQFPYSSLLHLAGDIYVILFSHYPGRWFIKARKDEELYPQLPICLFSKSLLIPLPFISHSFKNRNLFQPLQNTEPRTQRHARYLIRISDPNSVIGNVITLFQTVFCPSTTQCTNNAVPELQGVYFREWCGRAG